MLPTGRISGTRYSRPYAARIKQVLEMKKGHEIANEVRKAGEEGRELALLMPVYPAGMFTWAVYFLKEWGTDMGHVHCFQHL